MSPPPCRHVWVNPDARWIRLFAVCFALLAILLLLGITRCRTSWYDEAYYASAAVNWMRHGQASFAYLVASNEVWAMPHVFYPACMAAFYRLCGIGLMQTRLFGLLCYAVSLSAFLLVLRRQGLGRAAALTGTLFLGLDRSLVWFVRSGRPDPLPIAALSLLCLASTAAVAADTDGRRALPGLLAGVCAALSLLGHPCTAPAVALILSALVLSLPWRTPRMAALSCVWIAIGGCLAAAPFAVSLIQSAAAFRQSIAYSGAFLTELGQYGTPWGERFAEELSKRWMRGAFTQCFQWLFIALSIPALVKSKYLAGLLWGGLAWIVGYFVSLALFVPKNTWYQLGYVAIPVALLTALAVETMTGQQPEPVSAWSRIRRSLCVAGVVAGFAQLSLYPLTALLQWKERSYSTVVRELSAVIPSGSRVATTESAYLALLENGCDTVFLVVRTASSDYNRLAGNGYQRRLFSAGIEFVVVVHDSMAKVLDQSLAERLTLVGTVGAPKRPLPWAKDSPYCFDVYRVLPPDRADG